MKNNKWLGARLAGCFVLASLLGPLSSGSARGAYVDCRLCHLDPAPGSGAQDYYNYFFMPQHPTGMAYPLGPNQEFFRPTGSAGGITFFDRNGNGIADIDEVQMFGVTATVECASCHREHGDSPSARSKSSRTPQPNMYLRLGSDLLCMVCHRI